VSFITKYSVGIVGLLVIPLIGCSRFPVGIAIIESNKLSSSSDIPLYLQETGTPELNFPQIRQGDRCRVKYHSSFTQNRWMVVEGTLENGRSYPVVLDTGATPALFVTDIHIIENKLPVYPLSSDAEPVGWGLCDLPGLQIGSFKLDKPPCMYKEQHTEIQFFGLPVAADKAIIAGLPLLRQFSYIAFDSVAQEVEFSYDSKFQSFEPAQWTQYKLEIEEDLAGNTFLFVTIPIAGLDTKLQLDTGSGRGLAIGTKLWNELQKRIHAVKLTRGTELYPYIGRFDCQKGSIAELEVGDRTVQDAKLAVLRDDCLLLEDCHGLVGMQYFQDTVIVLDFERNLMWVRNKSDNNKTLALENTHREPVLNFQPE
jgi:hypothetical protein